MSQSLTLSRIRLGMSVDQANNFDLEADGAGNLTITNVGTGKEVGKFDGNGLVDPRVMRSFTLAERVNGQEYLNDTGMELTVYVTYTTANTTGRGHVAIDGVVRTSTYYGLAGGTVGITCAIPDGATYTVTFVDTSARISWAEYRKEST